MQGSSTCTCTHLLCGCAELPEASTISTVLALLCKGLKLLALLLALLFLPADALRVLIGAHITVIVHGGGLVKCK